jgi:hypothetical protein
VRVAIQRSRASLAWLSRQAGINPGTVAKWRKRETVEGPKIGAKEPHPTVLTEAEEAAVVAFRISLFYRKIAEGTFSARVLCTGSGHSDRWSKQCKP